VDLGIQHAKPMRHIVICYRTGCTVFFSPRYLVKGTILEKNVMYLKYVF